MFQSAFELGISKKFFSRRNRYIFMYMYIDGLSEKWPLSIDFHSYIRRLCVSANIESQKPPQTEYQLINWADAQ